MVASGLVVGFATGGFPVYSREISQLALVVGMTFALTEISFAQLSPRAEARGFLVALAMTYVVLSGLVLAFAYATPDSAIRDGWVLMAAVPPAIAVVPITSYLKGDTRRAVVSLAILYVLGLVLVPTITLAFANQAVPPSELLVQTALLIGLPLGISRVLGRWPPVREARQTGVSVSFFFLVIAIAGSTRAPLLARPDLVAMLSLLAFLRTFGLGAAVFLDTFALGLPRDARISMTTFGTFKNLGLTVVLAFAIFGPTATLPSIVSLVFEILWLAALPLLFPRKDRRIAPDALEPRA
jgi:BASS family bile acid:Na+ symporter